MIRWAAKKSIKREMTPELKSRLSDYYPHTLSHHELMPTAIYYEKLIQQNLFLKG